MRAIGFIIFFTIFFSVFGSINYYIFVRGAQALPPSLGWRRAYLVVFLFLSLSFIAGRFLERAWASPVSEALVWIGSFWLGATVYFFLSVLALDIVRLANTILPFYPQWLRDHYRGAKQAVAVAVSAGVIVTVIAGFVNAANPRVRQLTLKIPKKVDGLQSMTIAVASDIHMGTIVGRRRVERIVDRINALDADLVLLPGDIVDEDLGAVIRENIGEALKNIRSRHGVYAITGNHEYIGGVDAACDYLLHHGVTMLRDGVARVNGGVYLVGREDRMAEHTPGMRRAPLKELMAGIDRGYPVILLDHQPFRLEEGARNGADLQISGHTHHGQLWPFNHITSAIYEVSWGYKQIGWTHIYVSSGAGTWGPPMRVGNHPEILHITLTFD